MESKGRRFRYRLNLMIVLFLGWITAFGGAQVLVDKANSDPQQAAARPDFYAWIVEARHMKFEPPATNKEHFRLSGQVEFGAPQQKEVVRQECTIALGGAARQRFTLKAGNFSNHYVVYSEHHGWKKEGRNPNYSKMSPESMLADIWTRWTLLRFPWNWQEALASCAYEETNGHGYRLHLEGPYGKFTILLNAENHPTQLKWPSGQSVDLSQYKKLRDGRRYPSIWFWEGENYTRKEQFLDMLPGVHFLDHAFRPPQEATPLSTWAAALEDHQKPRRTLQDEFGFVQRPAAFFAFGPPKGDWLTKMPKGSLASAATWRVYSQGKFTRLCARMNGSGWEQLPQDVSIRKMDAGIFLRWVTYSEVGINDAQKRLAASLTGTPFSNTGFLWVLNNPLKAAVKRREFLFPVQTK